MKSQSSPIYTYEDMQEVKEYWQTRFYIVALIVLVGAVIIIKLLIA